MPPLTLNQKLRDKLQSAGLPLLQLGFGAYFLLFPLGISAREICGAVTLVGLLLVYLFDFKGSNLARFPLKWLYLAFVVYLAIKVAHSVSPTSSWYVFKGNIHKGIPLFLAGLEFIRTRRNLTILGGLIAVMACYEGLDGVWQHVTGRDFIRGTPIHWFRLTGSMSSPRVGNAMVMILPPAMGLFYIMPQKWNKATRLALTALCVAPGLFLLFGSYTRSAWFGFVIACVLYCGLKSPRKGILALFIGILSLSGAELLADVLNRPTPRSAGTLIDQLLNNPRVHLWSFALDFFRQAPILGSGLNTFSVLAKQAHLTLPSRFGTEISHPHNIYLQLLVETGIVGLSIYTSIALGIMGTAYRSIRKNLHDLDVSSRCFGNIHALIWCSYGGYMVTGLTGHSFFRSWWLGLSLAMLGVIAGSSVIENRIHQTNNPPQQ